MYVCIYAWLYLYMPSLITPPMFIYGVMCRRVFYVTFSSPADPHESWFSRKGRRGEHDTHIQRVATVGEHATAVRHETSSGGTRTIEAAALPERA